MRAIAALAAVLAAGLAHAAGLAYAAEFEPTAWLKETYDRYHRAEKDSSLLKASASDLVLPHASKDFAALLKRDRACSAKGQVCALDWDFIVNGQDFQLSNVKVGPLRANGDSATVAVDFLNMKAATTVVYHLVKDGGGWRIDDVEDRRKGEKPVSIARTLRDFKE